MEDNNENDTTRKVQLRSTLESKRKEAQRRANLEKKAFIIVGSAHEMYRVQPADWPEEFPPGWKKLETIEPENGEPS